MAKWLKQGKSENEIIESDAEVRRTVEMILSDVGKSIEPPKKNINPCFKLLFNSNRLSNFSK